MHLYFFTGENFCERNLPGSEILVKKFFEHDELEKTSSIGRKGKRRRKKDEKRGLADFAAPFVQSGKRMKGSKGMCHCSSIESKIEKQASTTILPKFSNSTNSFSENRIVFEEERC